MSPICPKSQYDQNVNVPNIPNVLMNVPNFPKSPKFIADSFQSPQYPHQYLQYLHFNILNLAIFSTVQACTVPNIPISQYDLNILKTSSSDFYAKIGLILLRKKNYVSPQNQYLESSFDCFINSIPSWSICTRRVCFGLRFLILKIPILLYFLLFFSK